MNYTMTNNSVTVVVDGSPHTIKRGDPNFDAVVAHVKANTFDKIPMLISKGLAVTRWAQGLFRVQDNHLFFEGEKVPQDFNAKIFQMAKSGKDPRFLMRFYQRLMSNPSWNSVQQLFRFITNKNISIAEDGTFLAYKSVTRDYLDWHTKTVSNHIGTVNFMRRNKISDDPTKGCHFGYHVGSHQYASTFNSSGRLLICKVDPADVVCVPTDGSQKVRVCKYKVVGHYGDQLPGTIFEDEILEGDFDFKIGTDAPPPPTPPVEPEPEELPDSAIEMLEDAEAPVAPPVAPQTYDLFLSSTAGADKLDGLIAFLETDCGLDFEEIDVDVDDVLDGAEAVACSLPEKEVREIVGHLIETWGCECRVEPEIVGLILAKTDEPDLPATSLKEARLAFLNDMTLGVMRKMATNDLGIKRAGHLRGGKPALIAKIIEMEFPEPTMTLEDALAIAAEKGTWDVLNTFPEEELGKVPLGSLRKYATYGLKIVGASKIRGGKAALLERILDVRS
jgi:hypothetical protein